MANGKLARIMTMMVGLAMLGFFTITAMAADVPRITVEDLKAQLYSNDVIIVDVRSNKSWEISDFMIKGAIRVEPNPKNLISWAGKHKKDQKIVLYCTWPNEGISASLAQKLIDKGYTQVYALKGGWKAWVNYPGQKK